ncbi:MAG: putative inorganic carbon transporter subunit DabA, partial [Methylococcaceae bacterium]
IERLTALTPPPDHTPRPNRLKAQALFCIDDRECSLRQHLEAQDSAIETYGAAGFFGIDFFYQGLDDAYAVAQCPVVVTPKHLIIESRKDSDIKTEKTTTVALKDLHFKPESLLRHWIFTQTLGLGYAARLAFDVFRPGSRLPNIKQLGEVEAHTHLHLLREHDEPTADGRLLGFSHQEMAAKLGGLLRTIGLTQDFAPLVVVVAHGSSSVNNPHFAAYDCGACAGKPGAPNARAFTWMANDPTVRQLLAEQGIAIPADTRFVPALHNTSRDEITYFDQHLWDTPPPGLSDFQKSMQQALGLNAMERCRWFELGPVAPDPESALKHAASRSSSIFEPRPELNHSNNLYCVVGRRPLTSNLYLDRRAFLHSYDPMSDPSGETLRKILTALIPVCGGINLEYLFSRLDNSVYGAGTKLPHNVMGLIGVANGVDGDLRTGLPSQMVEVHEPARLLFVIEQTPSIILAAVSELGELKQVLDNRWVRLASCHPATGQLAWYTDQGFKPLILPQPETAAESSSEDVFQNQTRTIPVTRIIKEPA